MTLLFICRGGVFRSRIAQALARHANPNNTFISSGIKAESNLFGDISAHCEYVLKKHQLLSSTQPSWIQTNQVLIDNADKIVFMSPGVYRDAQKMYLITKPHTVWDINDIEIPQGKKPKDYDEQLENIFQKIKAQIKNLDLLT